MTSLVLSQVAEGGHFATLTPPQTVDGSIPVGKGAYCFVIDVSGRFVTVFDPAQLHSCGSHAVSSRCPTRRADPRVPRKTPLVRAFCSRPLRPRCARSMNAAASITTDDGDKVNHGWSQLDIAKHSTNTFVSSLEDGDYFAVVTYSDGANVCQPASLPNLSATFCHRRPPRSRCSSSPRGPLAAMSDSDTRTASVVAQVLVDWTKCDEAGRERCIAAIHSMKPERSTNLMAGITSGFTQFEKFMTLAGNDELDKYALNLVITTDGARRDGPRPSVHRHRAALCDPISPC